MKTFFNDDHSKLSGPKKSINKDKSSNDAIEKRKMRFFNKPTSKSNKDEIKDIPLPSTSRQQITLSDVKKTSTPLSPTRQIMNQLAKQAIANIPLPKKQVPQLAATTSTEPQSVPTKRPPIKISFNKKELATAPTPSFTSQSSTNQRKSLPATKKSGNQINYSSESSGDEDFTKKSSSDNTLNVGFKLASAPTLQRLSKSTPSINKLESTPKTMMPLFKHPPKY
ncbi:hypothetical protein M3Y97_00987700 [Aphelenchoides bicaudatus]|nr:hypothetical protein M3Y97_00987700 [Aphelenchoides bicaudatus]